MPSDSEIDRQIQAQWSAIERVKSDVQAVKVNHAVIDHKVSDLATSVMALRDSISENHGATMSAMQDIKNDMSEFKIQTARELAANEGKDKGKSEMSSGVIAFIGIVCTIIGALVAVIGVTKGVGA